MTETDTLKSKMDKQRSEIARLTQALEKVTAETIRRRRIILAAVNDTVGWRDQATRELGVMK